MTTTESQRKASLKYQRSHVEKIRQYRKVHAEENRIKAKQYYKTHIEERKRYYADHVEEIKQRNRQYWKINTEKNKQRQRERREEFRLWKEFAGPCVKCGNVDGRVLDFHHLERAKKEFCVNTATWYRVSLLGLVEELAKCAVFCSNCHRIEEWKQ